jgi:hypothetical protein
MKEILLQKFSITPEISVLVHVRAKKTDCNQSVVLIAEDSFHRLLEVSEWHARHCKDNLQSTKIVKKGHVVKTNLKCHFFQQSSFYGIITFLLDVLFMLL